MSDARFKDKGNKLGRFIEECGEALAAAGKTIRFGEDSYNPLLSESKREKNIDWLQREVKDLEEAIQQLKERYGWD
jgi:hypothetical protein